MTEINLTIPPSPWLTNQDKASVLSDTKQFVLYGGSRGPGKSYWLRWQAISDLILWGLGDEDKGVKPVPGVVGGLFCETFPELKRRQLSKIKREVPRYLGVVKESRDEGLALHLHDKYGGGVLLLGNLDDASKYQSTEMAIIAVDELTKNNYETFDLLRGSLRYPGIPNPKFLGATNPGGIGHSWVKALWVDQDFSAYPKLAKIKDRFAFVRALPADNPYLTQDYYDNVLGTLGEDLEQAWRFGSWTHFKGMVFKEWREDIHTCEPFSIPEHWIKRRGIDPGYSAPACVLWSATNPDNGRIYIYREAYGPGVTDQAMARTIKAASGNEVYQASFGDPAMWVPKNVQGIVTSAADEFAAEGVALVPGDNKRLNGKAKVHRVLAPMKDGEPGLVAFETCRNFIRTLPALVYSEVITRLEDVDTTGEDHPYDALRYLLTDLAPGDRSGDNGGPDKGTQDWMRQAELLAQHFG